MANSSVSAGGASAYAAGANSGFCVRALLALALALAAGVSTAARIERKTVRILFIGNSYTYLNDLPNMIWRLAKAGGQSPLKYDLEAPGGCTLERHWKEGRAVDKIKRGEWDYVVLQEQSQRPLTDRALMFEYAAKLEGEIKAVNSRTMLYQTWARKDAPETQAELSKAYLDLGNDLGARVAPVGMSWEEALKTDSSLVLHDDDNSHPNMAGTYLAACVFYAVIYGKSPEGLPGAIGGLSDEAARTLQLAAWRTVRRLATR